MNDFDSLVSKHLHGELDAAGAEELARRLKSDPRLARRFAADAALDRGVRAVAERMPRPPRAEARSPAGVSPRGRRGPWPLMRTGLALAAAASVLIGAFAVWPRGAAPARVAASVGAAWAGDTIDDGATLPLAEPVTLDAGLALVRFDNGARVVVEGPAVFSIRGDKQVDLTRGKLVALCDSKETHGFTVETPAGRVVDLGTEFGVDAAADGDAHVYVFDGEVQLFRRASEPRSAPVLRAGQAASLRGADAGRWSPDFVTAGDFRVAAAESRGSNPPEWAALYETLRADPDLVFWSDFDRLDGLEPFANLGRYADARTRIVGDEPVLVAGRSPGNEALRCDRGEPSVSLDVTGVFRSLTLAAWVRLDAPGDAVGRRGLLLSDWGLAGELHWQLKGEGVRLSRRGDSPSEQSVWRAPLGDRAAAEWTLLTTVVDGHAARSVAHYADGEVLGRVALEGDGAPLLRLGHCGVGGWADADDPRALRGAIDDLMIWRRALSDAEVSELWRSSK